MEKRAYQEPTAGVFYLVPNKKTGQYEMVSEFEEPGKDVVHLFLWDHVVKKIQMKSKVSIDSIADSYRGLPRGRIIAPHSRDGRWVIGWGNDFPLANYKSDIISEFQLGDADGLGHVQFEHQAHEEMISRHKKDVEKLLGIEITSAGFKVTSKK